MTVALRPLVAAALALGMLGLAIDAARADTTNVIGKYFDPQKRNVYTFILTVTGNDGSRRALVGFPIAPGRDPHVATFSTAAEWSRFVALWREAKAQPRSGVSANASMVASGHYPAEYNDTTMMLFLGIDPAGSIRIEVGRSGEPDSLWWGASLKKEDEAAFDRGIAEVSAFFAAR